MMIMMIGWVGGQTDEYVTLPPPPGWRIPRRNRNTREGGWAPWRLIHWGSLQGGPGAPVDMADREPQLAMADGEPQVAMADREPRTAKAYFLRVARAGQGAPWPWS